MSEMSEMPTDENESNETSEESTENMEPVKKVTEQECAEVRWFYERQGESKWTPFKGCDSMTLELNYRNLHNISIDEKAKQASDNHSISERIFLLDNLYEWNPKTNPDIITSVYWKEASIKICRGTWFYSDTLHPLESDFAEAIEKHHLEYFRDQPIVVSEHKDEANVTTLKWKETGEVKWNSVIDILFFNNTKANRFIRLLTRKTGIYPLRRGFITEADIEDGRPNFSDLILVVHGVGHKGHEHSISKNTTLIRDAIETLMKRHYPNEKRRPMVLPIEWRSALTLDRDLTETITLPRMGGFRNAFNSSAMDLMYYQSPLYRQEIMNGVIHCLNTTYAQFVESHPNFNGPVSVFAHSLGSVIAYDIITNWSPVTLYDDFITAEIKKRRDTTKDEAKRTLYDNFYQSRTKLEEDGNQLKDILLGGDEPLSFKVKFLFCVGSPLAVFLVMRGHSNSFIPDKAKCEQILNIFHPYDPVAYRLEPLFHEAYKIIRPVNIFTYSGCDKDYEKLGFHLHKSCLKRMRQEAQKKAKIDIEDNLVKADETCEETNSFDDSDEYQSSNDSPLTPRREGSEVPANNQGSSGRWWRIGSSSTVSDIKKEDHEKDEVEKKPLDKQTPLETLLDTIPEEKRLPKRLDYAIQSRISYINYLSLIKSHSAYWNNLDVVGFILNQLYAKKEEPKQSPEEKEHE